MSYIQQIPGWLRMLGSSVCAYLVNHIMSNQSRILILTIVYAFYAKEEMGNKNKIVW